MEGPPLRGPSIRGSAWPCSEAAPDFAEFIIGSAGGQTRWLHPGYASSVSSVLVNHGPHRNAITGCLTRRSGKPYGSERRQSHEAVPVTHPNILFVPYRDTLKLLSLEDAMRICEENY